MNSKPTLEEIATYVKENGLEGKVSPTRFYDYYSRQNFMFRGLPMDWKSKLHEWAKTQRSPVQTNASDYKLAVKNMPRVSLDELRQRVAMI